MRKTAARHIWRCSLPSMHWWNTVTIAAREPVAMAALSTVFGDEVVGLDDSHLKTLDKSSKHGVFRGHLWCFIGTDSARATEHVGYGYTQSWEATDIADWLGAIVGFIQGAGYAGYSTELEDEETGVTFVLIPDERRLGCRMHIRSKFHDALLAQDKRAAVPLKHFADLYEIEAECKGQGFDAGARVEQRRRRSLPIVDAFDHWVDAIHPKLLPKSPLRRATTYAIHQRAFFRRCFEDGRFEIDNGRVERRIRNFAVGRRNYLFTGSARGGERLAAAYTLVDNCTLLGRVHTTLAQLAVSVVIGATKHTACNSFTAAVPLNRSSSDPGRRSLRAPAKRLRRKYSALVPLTLREEP